MLTVMPLLSEQVPRIITKFHASFKVVDETDIR